MVGHAESSYYAYNFIDVYSRFVYSKTYPVRSVDNAADAMLRALRDISQQQGRAGNPPNARLRHAMHVNVDNEFDTDDFKGRVQAAFPQVQFLVAPPHSPNAQAFVERFNGSMVNLMSRVKMNLVRNDATGGRWPGTAAGYRALWKEALELYNDTRHSGTRERPRVLALHTDVQAAAQMAAAGARAANRGRRPNREALPSRARQREFMAPGSLHRLINAELQKMDTRGYHKWADERYSFEVYEVVREARTARMANVRVFVREHTAGYPYANNPAALLAQVATMTAPDVLRHLRLRRQPAPYPKAANNNATKETVVQMRRRLQTKLRREVALAGGELPVTFAYQNLSPVGWPVGWPGDNQRTYPAT